MPAGTKTAGPKPRLRKLDDLFDLTDGENPLITSTPIIETQTPSNRMVVLLAIEQLTPFRNHPFRLYEGERLDDMVESIKKNGILIPILVRRVDGLLEILSGHNRVHAGKLAGLEQVPATILENISDEDAMVYVIETNLLQRSFKEMEHSEKAAVIALHHSKMFSQGKRNDILEQLEMLENPHEYRASGTCSQVANKSKTISKVGKEYGLSKDTIARYLRINRLIPELKAQLDNGNIAFIPAAELSHLQEANQRLLIKCIEQHGFSVDMKKADMLRKLSGNVTETGIYRILSGEARPKPNRTPTVKVRKDLYAKYFNPSQTAKEVQAIVEDALEQYFAHK